METKEDSKNIVKPDKGTESDDPSLYCSRCKKVPYLNCAYVHEMCGNIICADCKQLNDHCTTCGKSSNSPLLPLTHESMLKGQRAGALVEELKQQVLILEQELRICREGLLAYLRYKNVICTSQDTSQKLVRDLQSCESGQKAGEKGRPTLTESPTKNGLWDPRPSPVPNVSPAFVARRDAIVQEQKDRRIDLITSISNHYENRTPSSTNRGMTYSPFDRQRVKLSLEDGVPHSYCWYDVVLSYEPEQFLIQQVYESYYRNITSRCQQQLFSVTEDGSLVPLLNLSVKKICCCIYHKSYFYIFFKTSIYAINKDTLRQSALPALNLAGKIVCAAGVFNGRFLVLCTSTKRSSCIKIEQLDLCDIEAKWQPLSKLEIDKPLPHLKGNGPWQIFEPKVGVLGFCCCVPHRVRKLNCYPQIDCRGIAQPQLVYPDHYTTTVLFAKGRLFYAANATSCTALAWK